MTYAIVQTGGKQTKVQQGDVIRTERIRGKKPGDPIEFDPIPLLSHHGRLLTGKEIKEEQVRVVGRVEKECKDKKIQFMKFKRHKNYQRKKGHRQTKFLVKIEQIIVGTSQS